MGKTGKLLFKGDHKRPKKKSKKSKTDRDHNNDNSDRRGELLTTVSTSSVEVAAAVAQQPQAAQTKAQPILQTGTGTITTSGTVVTGHGTKFEKELSVGDAILATIRGTEEMRVVTMRLSDGSLNLSSAFSESLREPLSFRYVRKPRNADRERRKQQQRQLAEASERDKSAFDIYGGSGSGSGSGSGNGGVYTYREKTETGSYRVKTQSTDAGTSRGGLLNLRAKKTSDKYC